MKTITFSAPGKIIISGEHSVVYGHPALVAAVNRRISLRLSLGKANNTVAVHSKIPRKSGMGSSAAFAAVTQASVLYLLGKHKLDKERINALAWETEKAIHGNPSGVDNTVAVYGGILLYQKNRPLQQLNFGKRPKFMLINTGRPKENTGEMVAFVGAKLDSQTKSLLEKMGSLPRQFVRALQSDDYQRLRELVGENERLLEELGVVGKKAQAIIRQIEALGGAAKICGAGGFSQGSGIALVLHHHPQRIRSWCNTNKVPWLEVKLGEEGLRIEK